MRENITVGTDVEFFLNHRHAGIIPATRMNTPGTKLMPIPLWNGTFHRDNISVEIQPPPANTPADFISHNQAMYQALSEVYFGMEISLTAAAVMEFDDDMVATQEAQEIGCEADVCAYSGEVMPPTSATAMRHLRTASGHIHIGNIDDLSTPDRQEVVKHLDHMEGSALMLEEVDMEHVAHYRRRYYGQTGRYRLKPYGLEWRTPSALNWYTWVQRRRAKRLFGSIYSAVRLVDAGIRVIDLMPQEMIDYTRKCIDGALYEAMHDHVPVLNKTYMQNKTAWDIIQAAGEAYEYPPIFAE